MADIVTKLMAASVGHPFAKIPWPHRVLHEAADEIAKLRAALEPFACACEGQCMADAEWASPPAKPSADICAHFAARAALEGPQDRMAKPLGGENV